MALLLKDAIGHAKGGIAVTRNQANCTAEKLNGLHDVPGFAATYLIMLLSLLFTGGGRFTSVDYWISQRFQYRASDELRFETATAG